MKIAIFIACCLFFNLGHTEYIGLSSSSLQQQHNYIGQDMTIEQQAYGAELNLQSLRYEKVGWLARGPRVHARYSANSLFIDAQVNLYQTYLHQGIWFHFEWLNSQFNSTVSNGFIYLDESGNASAINSGDAITGSRTLQTGHVYWYESVKEEGPINTAGLFYSVEANPASSELTTTNADLFDGGFSGFGFTLGRIKDDRGLNFQWRLTLARLTSDFSNDATNHQSLSSIESKVNKLGVNLDWHYRYYLAPYWYVVPSAHFEFSTLMQSQLAPELIEHDALNYSQYSLKFTLRRYF